MEDSMGLLFFLYSLQQGTVHHNRIIGKEGFFSYPFPIQGPNFPHQTIVPDIAAPGGLVHSGIPFHNPIPYRRLFDAPPCAFQIMLAHTKAELEYLICIVANHQIPVRIRTGRTTAKGLGSIGIRKYIVRMSISFCYGQRCV